MKSAPPTDSTFLVLDEPEVCQECNSGSRLSNGLCLHCLLRSAIDEDDLPSGRDAFKEALAAVKSGDGDWRIADHEILEEIARGGMGVIYRAREPHSERIVALKCVLAYQGDSDQAVARFRREAEMVASLDHPNIVPIYQIGETADGFPFFTMKYAANGSLQKAGDSFRRDPRESVRLMAKVARAVQYAHKEGVLHRDLKPGNILLDGRGEPLVSDFGLARCEETSSQLTRSLASFGTPGYIAPEQADGPAAQLTPAADIYSLGAILFELLADRPPFVGDNAFAVMKQAAENPAPKLRTLAPHLDRDLQTICERCLERDVSARYQSAEGLADDLENWLENLPIIARPIGLWQRSRRWARTNRRLAALLAIFLVLVPVSVGWRIHGQKLQSAMHESLLASRSVVVVPFLDLDKVAADPRLTQSLASSLQAELNAIGPARVKTLDNGSAMEEVWAQDFRQVGQQAGTRTVLTGTVRTVQDRKRISIRLLDAANGDSLFTTIWEEHGARNPVEAAINNKIGKIYSILSANDWSDLVQAKVDPGLRNPVAREAILAGRELLRSNTIPDYDNAIALFTKALQAEPDSAVAHSYIAMTATARTHYKADLSFLELGKREADKAVLLTPESGEAHKARAGVCYQEGKFSEALEEQLRAIETAGLEERVVNFIGQILDTLGRPDLALNWHALPSQGVRTPGLVDALVGDCWVKLGDDEQAMHAYHRASEFRPDFSEGMVGLSRVRLLQGDFAGAREMLRSGSWNRYAPEYTNQLAAQIAFFARDFEAAEQLYQTLAENNPGGGGSYYGAVTYNSALARSRQSLGDDTGAKALLELSLRMETVALERAPDNPEAAYRLAAVEACLGMPEAALGHLRSAAKSGWIDYRSLGLDPRFDSLRLDPAFQTVINDLSAKVADMRSKTRRKTK